MKENDYSAQAERVFFMHGEVLAAGDLDRVDIEMAVAFFVFPNNLEDREAQDKKSLLETFHLRTVAPHARVIVQLLNYNPAYDRQFKNDKKVDAVCLEQLRLCRNPLGEEGATPLAAALTRNHRLRSLDLAATRLGDGAALVALALFDEDLGSRRMYAREDTGKWSARRAAPSWPRHIINALDANGGVSGADALVCVDGGYFLELARLSAFPTPVLFPHGAWRLRGAGRLVEHAELLTREGCAHRTMEHRHVQSDHL